MKTLLLTNDDGILAAGLNFLKEFLSTRQKPGYEIYVVAPDRERSGISMSITIDRPLRLRRIREKEFAVDGTPVDCINIALQKILPKWPDFIISGMNEGENLCEDVFFSGTVAGAYTGHLYGVPSLAASLIQDKESGKCNYEAGARITADVLAKLLPLQNPGVVYNLNIPYHNSGQVKVTTLGLKRYKPTMEERTDPRGKKYYWTGTGEPQTSGDKHTDLQATAEGHISLSVLKYEINDPAETRILSEALNDRKSKN